ncbi:MAG TPA: YbaN family protein [Methanofastidiosum sp.]|nr:YbaN family protein [Methanofastidiosum sp.]HNU61174.1 YbaN family protein [Methanofastidiosum sp.]HOI77897.1 YbaN family protein [Methanofastidiosum sp.]
MRAILLITGTISLVIGIVGIFIPLLPTTPFLLLTAACYAQGSDRFYNWLLCNKLFGNYIKNYREGKGVALNVKIISLFLLWTTILFSVVFVVSALLIKIILITIAIAVTIHIFTIRNIKNQKLNL